jgi:hypothetical protein
MKSGLAVLEGRWFKDRNTSVRSVFDLLCDLEFKNQHAYYYEMFCDKQAFSSIIDRVGRASKIKWMYIATHGNQTGICGSDRTIISRDEIIKAINKLKKPKPGNVNQNRINGLFFGSCLFGSMENAEEILDDTKLRWVAGYDTEADWIKSTLIDLYFWQTFFNTKSNTELSRIKYTAELISGHFPGARTHGFSIYIRKPGGGIQNLLEND